MPVTFSYSGTAATIQNPQVVNEFNSQKMHATGRTAGGQFYRYSKGITLKTIKLQWSNLHDDEKILLDSFFISTVSGPSLDFSYTDHRGTVWTAHFLTDRLPWKEIADERDADLDYNVGANVYHSTKRKLGYWEVEFELEVW
jgi:hypothetical protein